MRKPKYDFLLGYTKKFEMLKYEIYFKIMTRETGSMLNMFRKKKAFRTIFFTRKFKTRVYLTTRWKIYDSLTFLIKLLNTDSKR